MSLLFRIELTAPQIDLLRAFREWSDLTKSEQAKDRKWVGVGFPHFVVHIKPLLRERLIGYIEPTDKGGKIRSGNRWFITQKGRLLLKVIDFELDEVSSSKTILARRTERPAIRDAESRAKRQPEKIA